MRFLIVNDDGINAEGIKLLAKWAMQYGEVTVIAPHVEHSGKSHAIDFIHPIEIKRVDFMDGVEAWDMASTPADCVRFGTVGLKREYDLVLSGINAGVNMSGDIIYSGTVGAIFEAAALDHKAIAFSTFPDTLEAASAYFDMAYDFVVKNNLLDKNPIYNINIPAVATGVKITRQGGSYFADEFEPIGNNLYKQKGYYNPDADQENIELDAVAVNHGLISITPMQNDRTEASVYEALKNI
jgi:5'-nucleotidase